VNCEDVASVVWPRSAASMARGYRTIRGDRIAPVSPHTRGTVTGEVTDAGVLGRLEARTSNARPLGVRRNAVCQSTVKRGKRNRTKSMACTVRL
jgi:hypothetical protein